MLVRNATSYNDLESKRNLLMRLLEVEAENELENERRVAEFKNPYKPTVVPPRFKTAAEMKKDKLEQEKEAINHFITDFDFDYNRAGEMVAWLGDIERLNKFNTYFKGIKKELADTTNPKLLTSEFLKNYIDRYFEDVEVNFGHKFGRNDVAGRPVPQSLDELNTILPDVGALEELKKLMEDIINNPNIPEDLKDEMESDVVAPIRQLIASLPSPSLISYLRSSLTQQERSVLMNKLSAVSRKIKLISNKEVLEMLEQLDQAVAGRNLDLLEIFVSKAKRAVGFASANNLNKIYDLIEKYAVELDKRGNVAVGDELVENVDLEQEEAQVRQEVGAEEELAPVPRVRKKKDVSEDNPVSKAYKRKNLREFFQELELRAQDYAVFPEDVEDNYKELLNNTIDDILIERPEMRRLIGSMKSEDNAGFVRTNIPEMEGFITQYVEDKMKRLGDKYRPDKDKKVTIRPTVADRDGRPFTDEEGNPVGRTLRGIGLPKKIIKHLKEDDKETKALSKAFKKHMKIEEKADDESSSDEEMKKGKGFRHTRIKVGGGVRVREQPTYAHFGKYIIHMPHLTDKNVFNVKYPSKGSIPAIKPMTISDDYKDFVMEVLESGKMNERMLKKLPEQEIRHFEKVVSGAGLTEVLKLKRGNTDSEKKDMDRYYLLRGEIEAGNNAETVVKELRGLIVKFMNDGRVNKSEGLNLLMELSVI